MEMEAKLKIGGMHCASCEKLLKVAIEEVPGAKVLSISHNAGEAKVSVKDGAALAAAKKAIEAEGYKIL